MTKKIQIAILIACITLLAFTSCNSNSDKETTPAFNEKANANSNATSNTIEPPSVESKDSSSSESNAEEKKESVTEEENEGKEK